MKAVKNIISRYIWILIACVISSSCSEDESLVKEVVEGLPVSISFELTTPAPNQVTTRATDEQETKVEKLALFFYKDDTSKPVFYEVPDVGAHQQITSTNYKYNIEVPEAVGLTSGNWYIYAVANWHKGFWDKNTDIEALKNFTKSEMDQLCILKKTRTLDVTETSVLLTGKYGQSKGQVLLERTENNNGVNTLDEPIHLKRSIAKIIFKFTTPKGITFTPTTYDLHNYCRTSTLMEREGWLDVANPDKLDWLGSEPQGEHTNFSEGKNLPISKEGDAYSFMFYMPENVQKAKSAFSDKLLREKKEGNPESFVYAPDKGTYVVVHGKYEGPGENTSDEVIADVHYTIFLGDFSQESGKADNFTVRRNTKYTFNVNVKGVKNIIVEARAEGEKQPGAEGDVVKTNTNNSVLLDSHYETRIISFPVSILNQGNYGLVLKSPKGNIFTPNISTLSPSADISWIEFGKPVSTNQLKKYPGIGSEELQNVNELVQSFKDGSYSTKYLVSGGNVYIQAYVNEYYYQDWADADQLDKFVNAPNRLMTLATKTYVSPDEHSSYTEIPVFSIEQRSIKSMYNLKVENPFGLECTEDDGPTAINSAKKDVNEGSNKDDGRANFMANFKASDNPADITDGKLHWSTYVDFEKNTLKEKYNYGIYQGLLRNRDLNNDDIIDDNEIRWFLPSVNQHIAIWNGYHALTEEARLNKGNLYYTSTNGDHRTMWATEGAFGSYKSDDTFIPGNTRGVELVRCIRALKMYNQRTNRSSVFDASTNTFNVSGFGLNAIRQSGSQVGPYNYHSQFDVENKLPEAFKMAKTNLTATLESVPEKPADEHFAHITTGKENYSADTHTLTFDVTITNFDDGHKYYQNTKPSLKNATLINGATFKGEVKGYENQKEQDLYVISDNGNYIKIEIQGNYKRRQTPQWKYSLKTNDPYILPENKYVAPKEGRTTSTFTIDEIQNMDICKNYYENEDMSDKGHWRIPNQRELMVMLMLSSNSLGTSASPYELEPKTATCTYFDERGKNDGIFFIQVSGTFITSQNTENIKEFYIRPVLDVVPTSSSKNNFDSGFEQGGEIIK